MAQLFDTTHEPPGWERTSRYLKAKSQARWMGFVGPTARLPRFRARYRAAHAFEGIELDGYNSNTVSAYSAMIRLTLTWSALEYFLPLIGIDRTQRDQLGVLAEKHDASEILGKLRTDDCQKLFEVVSNGLDQESQRKRIERFLDGMDVSPVFLASAIRHSFAHGYLSPGDRRQATVKACNLLSGLLFRIMDSEFADRIRSYHESQIEKIVKYDDIEVCTLCEWNDTNCKSCGGHGYVMLDTGECEDDIPF